ncbi:hypothetical protein KSF78_0001307 [Schistosoma japonicum]|nr:hypothetical protein KSF78_0001307 [Schistosoma japonicum]
MCYQFPINIINVHQCFHNNFASNTRNYSYIRVNINLEFLNKRKVVIFFKMGVTQHPKCSYYKSIIGKCNLLHFKNVASLHAPRPTFPWYTSSRVFKETLSCPPINNSHCDRQSGKSVALDKHESKESHLETVDMQDRIGNSESSVKLSDYRKDVRLIMTEKTDITRQNPSKIVDLIAIFERLNSQCDGENMKTSANFKRFHKNKQIKAQFTIEDRMYFSTTVYLRKSVTIK